MSVPAPYSIEQMTVLIEYYNALFDAMRLSGEAILPAAGELTRLSMEKPKTLVDLAVQLQVACANAKKELTVLRTQLTNLMSRTQEMVAIKIEKPENDPDPKVFLYRETNRLIHGFDLVGERLKPISSTAVS